MFEKDGNEVVGGVVLMRHGENPLAVTGSKAMINYARDHTIADGLDYIGVWNAAMLSGAHMKEAFVAKAEKREPAFPDLLTLRDGPI